MSFRASLCFSWWLQWLCRSAHQLGRNKEDGLGGYNEEERTVILKLSKQYGWSDLQQIVSASRSQLLKCNKKQRIIGVFDGIPIFIIIFVVKI